MTKEQIKALCDKIDPKDEECELYLPKDDVVLIYEEEYVTDLSFEDNSISTMQGLEHFGEYDKVDWGEVRAFKEIE